MFRRRRFGRSLKIVQERLQTRRQNQVDSLVSTDFAAQLAQKQDAGSYASLVHTHTESDISDLGSYLTDAPSDGSQYARKDGSWAVLDAGGIAWGEITGALSAQTDLQAALDGKQSAGSYATGAQGVLADSAVQPGDLSTVAISGNYGDLGGIPGTFPPSAHTHTEADITDLGSYQPLSAVLTATTASYTLGEQSKLAAIEIGATQDQTDAEIQTAYNNQVSVASQAEAEAGTGTNVRRWTPQRIAQAIAALGGGGGGGSGTSVQIFSATKNGNQDLTGNAYQDVTAWDTPTLNQMSATFNATTGEFTVPSDGVYRVEFSSTLDQYSGNNRDSAWMQAVLDGTLIKGTRKSGYHRQTLHGQSTYASARSISATSGQVIKIQARNDGTSRLHRILADSTVFEVWKVG